jgi:hypothetical protein
MPRNTRAERIFIVPDVHVPFHDVTAWNCALKAIKECQPTRVVIIGDFEDFYAVSAHPKSLDRKVNFADEVDGGNDALDELQAVSGSASLHFCGGNHEWRFDRYLMSRAPELGGLAGMKTQALLKLRERGIQWIPYQRHIKFGNCAFTHDLGRAGVNAARQSLIDFGGNLVIGHTHRGGIAYQGESKGSSHFCLNVGWLGDVDAIDYLHRAKALRDWQHGYGIVDQDRTGYSWAQFVPILKGRCVLDGYQLAVAA